MQRNHKSVVTNYNKVCIADNKIAQMPNVKSEFYAGNRSLSSTVVLKVYRKIFLYTLNAM